MTEQQRKKNARLMIFGFILTVIALFMTIGHAEWHVVDIMGNALCLVGLVLVIISSTRLNKLMKAKTPN